MFNVMEMAREADRLPALMPEFSGSGVLQESEKGLSNKAKRLLEAFKPLLERAEIAKKLESNFGARGKKFELHTKLVMAQMLRNQYGTSAEDWRREATRADTDIPTYARQNIATILRAFPKLFTLQLFPTTVFSQPDGRIYFRSVYYNSTLNSSAPNVASGDRLDDTSKFNKGFAAAPEGTAARKLKMDIKSMTCSVSSYRLSSEWTYEAEDDLAAVYGDSLESALVSEMSYLLQLTTDRTMIDAAMSDANSTQTWDATPAGYDNLVPSEKKEYDNTIFQDGILKLITSMRNIRIDGSADPTWCVCGTSIAERFQKLTTFVPQVDANGGSLNTGLRDIGTLRQLGIRVIVDPMMDSETALFGSLPGSAFIPAIQYLPYKALRVTGKVEDPNSGGYEKGVYSRFGIARKNTGLLADSSQLGDLYGTLIVTP